MADKQDSVSQPTIKLLPSRLSPARLHIAFTRPTDALPLDIFRVLVGVLVFAYFLRTFFEATAFSNPDGLIDHELVREIFWFTRLGLFQPGISLAAFQVIFLLACLCSLALIVGYRVKLFAVILYAIAVCTYRWNFLVMYVDDSIMHLILFWLLLLPVGRTLVLSEWRADREGAWRRWKRERVSGAAMRCLLWNLSLIYIVAGLWKWTSPMWREGTALYVIFKLPISHMPDFWGPEHLTALKFLTYGSLILEPILPLIFILPRGHRAKYWLLLGLLGFHIGIVATLQIPFANIACIAAMIIPFGGELMDWLRRKEPESQAARAPARIGLSGAFALLFVTGLTLAMFSSVFLPRWRVPTRRTGVSVPVIRKAFFSNTIDASAAANYAESELNNDRAEGLEPVQKTIFSMLWCIGIAQQYQLFNWIDERNFYFRYEVLEYEGDNRTRELDPGVIFLESTRGVLLQSYLHGATWARIPRQRQAELRQSLQLRYARRTCQMFHPRGDVVVYATVERIVPDSNRGEMSRSLLMRFSCDDDGEPRMQTMNLDP